MHDICSFGIMEGLYNLLSNDLQISSEVGFAPDDQHAWKDEVVRLPAGKMVALVGTDIEGSTALYEWSQDIMQEAQDIHDSLLRAEMR